MQTPFPLYSLRHWVRQSTSVQPVGSSIILHLWIASTWFIAKATAKTKIKSKISTRELSLKRTFSFLRDACSVLVLKNSRTKEMCAMNKTMKIINLYLYIEWEREMHIHERTRTMIENWEKENLAIWWRKIKKKISRGKNVFILHCKTPCVGVSTALS